MNELRCKECGETRVIQDESSDLGYAFVVFGCYSQYYVYPNNSMKLAAQGNTCRDNVISKLKNYNALTPGETERLAWLAEELGEVQQIIGKIIRHGYESTWPPGESPTNRDYLKKELRDVIFVLKLMDKNKDIDYDEIIADLDNKSYKNCYLHHQEL